MMGAMSPPCTDCGEECVYVRSRFDIRFPDGALIAEEVPSLRCEACGRIAPAAHAIPLVDAVLELVQEVPAIARKNFSALPLRPDDPKS